MENNKRNKVRIIINLAIFVMVLLAWLNMFRGKGGTLASGGFTNLKYFTVLSNIYAGISCLLFVVLGRKGKEKAGKALKIMKLSSSASVLLTFTVVMTFLGPLYGYSNMFLRSNLFFHLIVPLTASAEFVIFNEYEYSGRDKLSGMIPVLLYGMVYIVNVLLHDTSTKYDIYGFVKWGLPIGFVIFAIIALIACAEGFLLCFLNKKVKREH